MKGCVARGRGVDRLSGFTLIELLVVMVIIGLVTTIAVLSVGNRSAEVARGEVERVGALLEIAGDEAVLQSRELGILFSPEGYRFMHFTKGAWQSVADDTILRERRLPAGFEFELLIDGLPVNLDPPKDQPTPQVIISSSGERSPFELLIASDTGERFYRLTAPPLGKSSLLSLAGT